MTTPSIPDDNYPPIRKAFSLGTGCNLALAFVAAVLTSRLPSEVSV